MCFGLAKAIEARGELQTHWKTLAAGFLFLFSCANSQTSIAQSGVTTQSLSTYYYPLAIGNSWTMSKNGIVGPASVVIGTANVGNIATLVLRDGFDGSEGYFTNDDFGLRLHQRRTPIFIPWCGTFHATEFYEDSPLTIIPNANGVGDIVGSAGVYRAEPIPCGGVIDVVFGRYDATSTLQAFERISVPAGPFDALRVQVTVSVAEEDPQSTTWWLAAGVGPVKVAKPDGTIEELVSTNVVQMTPNPIAFEAHPNVATDSIVISTPVTIAGITSAAAVSITGGEYSINDGAFTDQPSTVRNGERIRVRLISSTQAFAVTVATLTVGGVSTPFRVFTGSTLPGALLPILELLLTD